MDKNPDIRLSSGGEIITRAYLESLSTPELIKMADSRGVDIPFDLDRIFILEELLEIGALDSGGENEPDMFDSAPAEAAPLPKQYNITFIEVMIRDPFWAFVFWEIKGQDKEVFEKSQDFTGYYLKVSSLRADGSASGGEAGDVFTVPLSPADSAWYLSLNPGAADMSSLSGTPGKDSSPFQSRFRVELCAGLKSGETALAVSKPVILPGLPGLPATPGGGAEAPGPLLNLSGYEDFHILRRNERRPRAKKGSAGSHE